MAFKVHKVPALRGRRDNKDPKDLRAMLAFKALKDHRGHRGIRDRLASAHRVSLALKAHKDRKVLWATEHWLELKDRRVLKALRAQLVWRRVLKDCKALKDCKVLKDLRE